MKFLIAGFMLSGGYGEIEFSHIELLKLWNFEMRFFTSDLHFGHHNIIEYCNRPFNDVTHMNELLVRNWNDTVGPFDTVFILGDFAMGQIKDTLKYATRLNGNKYLMPGNHDRCWQGHVKKNADANRVNEWMEKYEEVGLSIIPIEGDIDIGGRIVHMCHFPYQGDSTEKERYSDFRPEDEGYILLHGHVHDAWKVNGRQINVGTDVWNYQPVSEDEILNIIHGVV